MRRILPAVLLCVISFGTSISFAQQQGQTPQPGAQTPQGQQTPRPGGPARDIMQAAGLPSSVASQNVALVITITDSLTAEVQNKKSVTMLVADGRSCQIRSMGAGETVINIDARPVVQRDGRILLNLTLEYRPQLSDQQFQQAQQSANRLTTFSESLVLLVPDGKPIVASQSSDPRSERKVSVEVMATATEKFQLR